MPIDQRGDTTGLASGPSRNTTTSPHHCALRTVRRTVRSLSVIVSLALSTAVVFVVARHCRAPHSHKQGAIASLISVRASIERRTTPDDRGGRWRSTQRLTSSHMARRHKRKTSASMGVLWPRASTASRCLAPPPRHPWLLPDPRRNRRLSGLPNGGAGWRRRPAPSPAPRASPAVLSHCSFAADLRYDFPSRITITHEGARRWLFQRRIWEIGVQSLK